MCLAGSTAAEGERSAPIPETDWSPGAWSAEPSARVQARSCGAGAASVDVATEHDRPGGRSTIEERGELGALRVVPLAVERVARWAVHTSTPARVVTHSHRRHSPPACALKSWLSLLSMAALVSTASPKCPRPPGRTQARGSPETVTVEKRR